MNPHAIGASSLVYSTYLGGKNNDTGNGIAVDGAGDAYVTGATYSPDFPTTTGAYARTYGGGADAFVTALNPAGNALLYSTYLGGTKDDSGHGIALDTAGNVYVTGDTYSANYPTTSGSYAPTFNPTPGQDAVFVSKLNTALTSTASLIYSTYLHGSGGDEGDGIAVDSVGDAYVTGYTGSNDFPMVNAFQTSNVDYASAFASEFNPTGSALLYSTYLGGNKTDWGQGIAVDGMGNAYVTGWTDSTNFPTKNAVQPTNAGGDDVFVVELNPTLAFTACLVYGTYLGGGHSDVGYGIAVDSAGNAYC